MSRGTITKRLFEVLRGQAATKREYIIDGIKCRPRKGYQNESDVRQAIFTSSDKESTLAYLPLPKYVYQKVSAALES